MTTPFPFPLVQMARTFMFIYIYTLPFALLNLADNVWVHGAIVFLVTYGFVGLETVSIELDDPFGEDDNDFDNLGMMYVSILQIASITQSIYPLSSTSTIRVSLHRL
jgi:predicted membrane chloride channel (bestrophin family)